MGADDDQGHLAPEHVLTNGMKYVNNTVIHAVESVLNDEFTPGVTALGVAEGALGFSDSSVPLELGRPWRGDLAAQIPLAATSCRLILSTQWKRGWRKISNSHGCRTREAADADSRGIVAARPLMPSRSFGPPTGRRMRTWLEQPFPGSPRLMGRGRIGSGGRGQPGPLRCVRSVT